MDIQTRLEMLLSAAEEAGIEIRRVALNGDGGGLCVLRGRRVLFVDLGADTATRYDRSVAALADVAELRQRYLPPELREDLERAAGA
jgi:hypothetical protein